MQLRVLLRLKADDPDMDLWAHFGLENPNVEIHDDADDRLLWNFQGLPETNNI